jgi:RNA polymerase subunit RPABC4/transcription elongation factor Spt4
LGRGFSFELPWSRIPEVFAGIHSPARMKVPSQQSGHLCHAETEAILYDPGKCPFCGSGVTFDWGLDLNVCYVCGAQETARGWMNPRPFCAAGNDTMTLAPDKELLQRFFTLGQKLGQLDAELTKIKAHIESLEDAIQDLSEVMRKK